LGISLVKPGNARPSDVHHGGAMAANV